MNGNNNAYHVSNQVVPTTNDQSKNNNSSDINVSAASVPQPPPPNHAQVKNDLMNNYWNNAIGSNEFGYQSSLQQPKQHNNNTRSPVELTYATPPILCDNQNQNANSDMSRDMFVRSDSILTDDDYVPFDAPAQSKFGPISRMSAKTSPYSTGKLHSFQICLCDIHLILF